MLLYRGFSDFVDSKILENGYLKTPRKPRDSHTYVHKVADDWFERKFGVKARSQTIFCTPDIEQAAEYGKPYEVSIPQALGVKLIFSIDVKDFIEIERDICDVNCKEEIINWLENKSYSMVTSSLKLPIDFDGEVMLYCEKYEVSEV